MYYGRCGLFDDLEWSQHLVCSSQLGFDEGIASELELLRSHFRGMAEPIIAGRFVSLCEKGGILSMYPYDDCASYHKYILGYIKCDITPCADSLDGKL